MEFINYHFPVTVSSSAVRKVCNYLAKHDPSELADGSYPIDGDNFFVNIFAYTTADEENRIWEAHRHHIDIHLVLSGEEIIHQAFLCDCKQGKYDSERDFLPISLATVATQAHLTTGRLAIFYPEDAHQTGLMVNEHPQTIRKAVFKIRI